MNKSKMFKIVTYAAVIVFAVLFLYFGNMIASSGMSIDYHSDVRTVEARVVEVLDVLENDPVMHGGATALFDAEILRGEHKGETVRVMQSLGEHLAGLSRLAREGDRVLLSSFDEGEWYFIEYVRIDTIVILGAIFVALLLIFGRIKGLNAILSLGFTCCAIFAVLIPAILSGKNIYLATVIVSAFFIIVSLFILYGITKMSIAAVAGCFGGVVLAGVLTVVMNAALELTGLLSEDSVYLLFLPTQFPIDLKAIIFAGIVIGAMGAIMDVAVSISSALLELKTQAPEMTFKGLFGSGITIGKDILGSMVNTLVLAYIGGSLSIILLLFVYSGSVMELLNREMVIAELLQALIGSLGIFLTIPLTALISAMLYTKIFRRGGILPPAGD